MLTTNKAVAFFAPVRWIKQLIMIPIKIIENPGIMAVTVSITYDPTAIKYQDFYYGDIFTDYTIAVHPDRKLIRLVICERRNRTENGNIISFKFKILDEAKAELKGVTLESLVVAGRVAKAIKVKAEKGIVDIKDFPLLMHIDEIITDKKAVNIPWESFTFER